MNVLIVDAGDDALSLVAYSSFTNQIAKLVEEYYPGTVIESLSASLGQSRSREVEVRQRIITITERISTYNLIIAYFPEALMLNAIMVWQAHVAGIPVVVFSPGDNHKIIASFASAVVRNFADLEEVLAQYAAGQTP